MKPGQIYCGDALSVLRTWPDNCVDSFVGSPPYWGLRDYSVPVQMGLEKTFALWLCGMVRLFEEVRRVLKPEGTAWVNMGDSYAHSLRQSGASHAGAKQNTNAGSIRQGFQSRPGGFKEKDLIGRPRGAWPSRCRTPAGTYARI